MSEEAFSSGTDKSEIGLGNIAEARSEGEENQEELDDEDLYGMESYFSGEIGEVVSSRFCILSKLGQGQFSNVWLCRDLQKSSFVALKATRCKSFFNLCADHEINMLKRIQTADPSDPRRERLVELSEHFTIPGKLEGKHVCLVFQTIGLDLFSYIHENYTNGAPMAEVKRIIRQILEGVDYLHSKCGVIHTDLKPENILICLDDDEVEIVYLKGAFKDDEVAGSFKMAQETGNEEESSSKSISGNIQPANVIKDKRTTFIMDKILNKELKVKINDLGNSCAISDHLTAEIQTRNYRSPEILLGANYDPSVDIWSIGCIAFELLTGEVLFNPSSEKDDYSTDEIHIGLMIQILGNIPKDIRDRGSLSSNYFFESGKLKNVPVLKRTTLFELFVNGFRYNTQDASRISDFLVTMLQYDPNRRYTAAQCLRHIWLKE